MSEQQGFYREYDLKQVQPSNKVPAAHQIEALAKLKEWFKQEHTNDSAGSILALPTGSGKTFTASRFLCSSLSHDTYDGPLSKGYKVLWLAHTHHLLEQALYSFVPEVGHISKQKQQLNVRVVSPGHCPVHSIKSSDDVVIVTLQTVRAAYKRHDTQLEPFLNAAGNKLFIVFDEAHHAPASSYCKLLLDLRKRFLNKMWLLGLTATPTYTDESKRGWLKELFPQEVIYPKNEADLVGKLTAEGILAKPEFEQHRTNFDVEFDEQEYKKWVNTYKDLPEDIIKKLAESEDRNQFIAETYVKDKQRYGKTIIFADRWFQCEALCTFLRNRGVKAGAIFARVNNGPGSVIADQKQVLEQFRSGDLEVLINIQMLTEGTDVPNAETVFLTRQTTSSILLTQMIGRGLRGPKFGGTDKVNIVSFIDNWKQMIVWGKSDFSGEKDVEKIEYVKQTPIELISIELVRRWAAQAGRGEGIPLEPFITLLPLGWYLLQFQTLVSESEEDDEIRQLLLVFDNEKESYGKFIQSLTTANIQDFAEIDVSFEEEYSQLEAWKQEFFKNSEEFLGENLLRNIFHIVRHIAQNHGEPPKWFDFEQRQDHDLDAMAQEFIDGNLGPQALNQQLKAEYEKKDRYWNVIYNNYIRFKEQYDDCANRILNPPEPPIIPPPPPPSELSDETKQQVKKRDSYRCLCCGENNSRLLQIDHIKPRYYGGDDSLDNLQTLCGTCNRIKGTREIDFRKHQTFLKESPSNFPDLELPKPAQTGDPKQWEQFIHRSANFFYQCAAVKSVEIKNRGMHIDPWEICIHADNHPRWLKPHLEELTKKIRRRKQEGGFDAPYRIIMTGLNFEEII